MSDDYEVKITYGASASTRIEVPRAEPTAEHPPEGYQQFGDLTRKLVQAHKAEVDARRQRA